MGNPTVNSYYNTNGGYTVYANGLIEQWGTVTTQETNSTVTVPIAYTSKDTYWITSLPTSQNTSDSSTYAALTRIVSNAQFIVSWFTSGAQPRNKQWKTIGY